MPKRKQIVEKIAKAAEEMVTPLLKLDLGCGLNKLQGFIGVDVREFQGVDQIADLTKPWPWKDNSVEQVHCSHFLEHLTQDERVHFFNELYRVLVPGEMGPQGIPIKGFAHVVTPAWHSERAYGDPTHKWPPVVSFAFHYLNKAWRAVNAPHTGFTCDFEFVGRHLVTPDWEVKNAETRMFAEKHYVNAATDMQCWIYKKV